MTAATAARLSMRRRSLTRISRFKQAPKRCVGRGGGSSIAVLSARGLTCDTRAVVFPTTAPVASQPILADCPAVSSLLIAYCFQRVRPPWERV